MQPTKHLLLIDDDEDDLYFFQQALKEINIPVNLSSNTDSVVALKQLREKTIDVPDLIFLDLNMPKVGGMELLAAIKKIHHLADVPIIICSTSESYKEKDIARKMGASYFLSKPAQLDKLCQGLNKIFSMAWSSC
jgi:CheY-like chemotaxis protein